jgi:hypothetical protein
MRGRPRSSAPGAAASLAEEQFIAAGHAGRKAHMLDVDRRLETRQSEHRSWQANALKFRHNHSHHASLMPGRFHSFQIDLIGPLTHAGVIHSVFDLRPRVSHTRCKIVP